MQAKLSLEIRIYGSSRYCGGRSVMGCLLSGKGCNCDKDLGEDGEGEGGFTDYEEW